MGTAHEQKQWRFRRCPDRSGRAIRPGIASYRMSSSSTSNTSTLCGGMLPTAWPP